MKTNAFGLFLVVLMTSFLACKSDDGTPAPGGSTNLGTFAGTIQVSDDPTTKVGYLYNAKVTVIANGSTATVKVVGEPGFDREYTGTYTSQIAGYHDVTINKQTKPTEKIAGTRVLIINNQLTITVDMASDNVSVWNNPNKTETLTLSGKIQMIGTNMLKE